MSIVWPFFQRRPAPCLPVADQHLPEANVFLSSTFIDMQAERDILTRLVFPRLRERMAGRLGALREIDLRWGVTEAMSHQEGAVRICFSEIERSLPCVLGIVGHRIGWQPSLAFLDTRQSSMLGVTSAGWSLTSLELRYARNCARSLGLPAPLVMLRSENLSATVAAALAGAGVPLPVEDASLVEYQRKMAADFPGASVHHYDSFEQFEGMAESGLLEMLEQHVRKRPPAALIGCTVEEVESEIDRSALLTALSAAARRRPTILFTSDGSGSTWVGERWCRAGPGASMLMDGRRVRWREFSDRIGIPLAASEAPDGISAPLAIDRLPIGSRLLIDHFEDAFGGEHQADLSLLPAKYRGGPEVVAVVRSDRLRQQAVALGWSVVLVEPPRERARRKHAVQYLACFGKHLDFKQQDLLAMAPWASRVGALALALDELRRFGRMEALDQHITTLAKSRDDFALGEAILVGISQALPPDWQHAPRAVVVAMVASRAGLEEEVLRQAAGGDRGSLPPSLWSAIRLSFRSAVKFTNGRIDLSDGCFVRLGLAMLKGRDTVAIRTLQRLRESLRCLPNSRAIEDLPGIALLEGGTAALVNFLLDPDNAWEVLNRGEAFAQSWLDALSPVEQGQLLQGWIATLSGGGNFPDNSAWLMARAAFRCNAKEVARALLELDKQRHPHRLEREWLLARLSDDPEGTTRQVRQALAKADSNEPAAARETLCYAIALAAEGRINLNASELARLRHQLERAALIGSHSLASGRIELSIGQLELVAGDTRRAVRRFTRIEALARHHGDARMLLAALDRGSAAALENNGFRTARLKAKECQELGRKTGLLHYEWQAFERLIECARRRTEWPLVYDLLETYLKRCREADADESAPLRMLADLESGV